MPKKSKESKEQEQPKKEGVELENVVESTKVKKEPISEDDELLTIPGVGRSTAEKLRDKGYRTIMSIAILTPKELSEEVGGISDDGADKIITGAKSLVNLDSPLTATALRELRKNMLRLTTSSPKLDALFKADDRVGIPTEAITEFYGEFGSGKTQICFQLAVNATMPVEKGGLDGHVLFIDTENTFRPNRIVQIALAQNLNPDEVSDKIHIMRVYNSAHQILAVQIAAEELARKVPIRLIIVDSLTAHFRSEYIGRGSLSDRQSHLNSHMHDLLKFAYLNHAAIVVTNQVLANVSGYGYEIKPIGGHIVGHTSTYRLFIKKAKDNKTVRMVDSPENADEEAIIIVSEEGVRDS